MTVILLDGGNRNKINVLTSNFILLGDQLLDEIPYRHAIYFYNNSSSSDPGPDDDYKKKTRRNRTTFSNSQLAALEKVWFSKFTHFADFELVIF